MRCFWVHGIYKHISCFWAPCSLTWRTHPMLLLGANPLKQHLLCSAEEECVSWKILIFKALPGSIFYYSVCIAVCRISDVLLVFFMILFRLSNHKISFSVDFPCTVVFQRTLTLSLNQGGNFYSRWLLPELHSSDLVNIACSSCYNKSLASKIDRVFREVMEPSWSKHTSSPQCIFLQPC